MNVADILQIGAVVVTGASLWIRTETSLRLLGAQIEHLEKRLNSIEQIILHGREA